MSTDSKAAALLKTEAVATLLARLRDELSAEFRTGRPTRLSRAPGRLDVMGGIADYTGSLVVQARLDRGAAVALQIRDDDQLQVFSFDLLDAHKPFTLRVPMRALAEHDAALLRREFAEPSRQWAAYLAGCLHVLHVEGLIDLTNPATPGINLALFSTVPPGAGAGSSASVEVATMMNLVEHFGLRERIDAMRVAGMCQRVQNEVVGKPGGVVNPVASCSGERHSLWRMVCQPHRVQLPLQLPDGVMVFGIDSGVRRGSGEARYGRTRCAAFMGHAIILQQMRELGEAAGVTLTGDPMNGYLANLDPDDYKKLFRPGLPEQITGREFLNRYGPTIDPATAVDPADTYAVQHAADHHVLEARRVRRFVESIEAAAALPPGPRRKLPLDRAGHLMYASHQSYAMDAMLGSEECDWLVDAVRQREYAGLYGARITGAGGGGTVAVLADDTDRVRATAVEMMDAYRAHTGMQPQPFFRSSTGAWHAGTAVV